jgi:hypothetical protein
MIWIYPLWTFHLFEATFKQHLHIEYISLRLYDIPELVVPITISLREDCCYKEATQSRVPFGKVEVITSKILLSPPWLDWPLWNICVKHDHAYDKQRSRKHTYSAKDRVTRTTLKTGDGLRCSGSVSSFCSTSGTRRVNLVTNPVISREWGKSVLLRYTYSDCPFGIVKLF